MPTYSDPSTGKKISSQVALSADELEEAFGTIGQPKATPETLLKTSTGAVLPAQSETGGFENFLIGTGYGMDKLRLGAMQLGASALEKMGLVSPDTVKALTSEYEEKKGLMKPLLDKSTAANVGEFVGEAALSMVVPGGVAGGIGRRLATSAAIGAGQGALQPTGQDESKLNNSILGAVFGTAGQGVMSGIGKVYNAVKSPIRTAVQDAADFWKIRVSLGEATDNPLWQKTEKLLENIPIIGMKGFRKAQQQEAETAGKKWLAQYVADPANVDNLVIAREANRDAAGRMFEAVKNLVGQVKVQEIAPTETKATVSRLLKRYPSIFKEFQDTEREGLLKSINKDLKNPNETVGTFEKWREAFQFDEPPTTGRTVVSSTSKYNAPPDNAQWFTRNVEDKPGSVDQWRRMFKGMTPEVPKPIEAIAKSKTLTFDEAWTLRKGLGEMVGQARKKLQSGSVDHTQLNEISSAYGAVSRDIDNWIDKIGRPDIKEAFKTANEAYKQYVVRFDILDDAMARAMGQRGAGEMFSPKVLSTELKNIAWKQYKLKDFTPAQIEEMTGLANIMQVVKEAGRFAENPPTGNRWGLPILASSLEGAAYVAGGAAASIKTAGVGLGVVGVARFLTGTESGKRLAIAASKIEPTSPQMESMMKLLPRLMTQAGIDTMGKGD